MPSVHYVDNPRQVQMALGGDPAIVPSLSDGSKYRSKRYLRFDIVPGSKPTQYLNGHNRKRAQVVCEWFDGKYKEGSAERAAKVAEAVRVRRNALQLFSKRKKKMKSTS